MVYPFQCRSRIIGRRKRQRSILTYKFNKNSAELRGKLLKQLLFHFLSSGLQCLYTKKELISIYTTGVMVYFAVVNFLVSVRRS